MNALVWLAFNVNRIESSSTLSQSSTHSTSLRASFFHADPAPCLILDQEGVVLETNLAFVKLLSSLKAPVGGGLIATPGSTFRNRLDPRDRGAFDRFFDSICDDLSSEEGEAQFCRFRLAGREAQSWNWRFTPGPECWFVRGQRQDTESRTALFAQHASSAIAVIRKRSIVDVNHRFVSLFGYKDSGEVIGRNWSDLAATEFRGTLKQTPLQTDSDLDAVLLQRDGTRFPARVKLKNAEVLDEPVRMLVVDSRSKGAMLPESGQLFTAIFKSAAIGIVLLDMRGRVVELNQAFLDSLGYLREELLGARGLELVHRKDHKRIRKSGADLLSGAKSSYRVEVRLKKRNKRLLWVRQTVTMIDVPGGDRHFLISTEDIDTKVKVEQNLSRRAEQLALSNADLEKFAYATSHDLREPLRTVSMFIQLLERRYSHQLDEQALDYIRYAVEGSQRMEKLLEGLLEFARSGASPTKNRDLVDLNEVLEEVGTNLLAEFKETNVLSEHLPKLRADRTQMVQLFQNLLGNANKFQAEGRNPEIIISVLEEKERYRFSVRDNGIGIEEEYFDRIFDLFQRLHERESNYDGSGVGLATCKRIVENYGGRIWVESDGQSGSTFHFTLKKP